MCEELGDIDTMQAYVEEAGNTSLCSLDGAGCDDRSKKFIESMITRGVEEQQKQLNRLLNMNDSSMKEDLKTWKNKRVKILQQMVQIPVEQEL